MDIIYLGLLAYLLTFLFIKILHKPSLKFELIDIACSRKQHQGVVPLTGGLSIFLAITITLSLHGQIFKQCYAWFIGVVILVITGLFDDLKNLNATSRLIAEIVATLIIIFFGDIYIDGLGNLFGHGNISLSYLSIPFTVFCVVGVINAINMIDGVDGLAGGIVLVALAMFGVAALIADINHDAILIFFISCAVLGFFTLNMRFPWRARGQVFMGDTGSMMLGFSLAFFAISVTGQDRPFIPPMVAVWILAIPVIDTITLILRRKLQGRSAFDADREHIHHILLRMGFKESQVVLLIVFASVIMDIFALVGWYNGISEYILFYSFIIVSIIYYMLITSAVKRMA